MTVPMIDHNIREVGSNALPDGNAVHRVDMTKGIIPRIRNIWNSKPEDVQSSPPAPPISADQKMSELRAQLVHYERQCAAASIIVEAGNSAPIQGGDIVGRKRKYFEWLLAGRDLADEPWVDASLLVSILDDHKNGGLIADTRRMIQELERRQAIDKDESENAPKREKAKARLAKAAFELSAAFEAALPLFPFPTRPCLRGVPTDALLSIYSRLKNVKSPDELI